MIAPVSPDASPRPPHLGSFVALAQHSLAETRLDYVTIARAQLLECNSCAALQTALPTAR